MSCPQKAGGTDEGTRDTTTEEAVEDISAVEDMTEAVVAVVAVGAGDDDDDDNSENEQALESKEDDLYLDQENVRDLLI